MTQVAIDGPSGAGKSTLARKVAEKIGFLYVDTGALYRTVGLAATRAGADTKDAEKVAEILPDIKVELRHIDGIQRVLLNGEDVSEAIRAESAGMASSDVAAHAQVRAYLLETQRRLAVEHNVIMDGRDIGTVVLPNADIKIFLTATPEERANRRYLELTAKGQKVEYETILEDVKKRDYNDSNREIAPLKQAKDAIKVDTTEKTFEQALDMLVDLVQEKLAQSQDGK